MSKARIVLVALVLAVAGVAAWLAGPALLRFWGEKGPASLTGKARAAPPASSTPQATEAERIGQLHHAQEADEKALRELEEADRGPGGEYQAAEAEFKSLDGALRAKEKELKALRAAGKDASSLRKELDALRPKWQTAREHFDLAIEHRKTRRLQAEALRKKITRSKAELARLEGDQPAAETEAPKAPGAAPAPEAPRPAAAPSAAPIPQAPRPVAGARPARAPAPVALSPAQAAPARPTSAPPGPRRSKEYWQARRKFEDSDEEANKAREAALSFRERIKSIKASIDLEKKVAEGARRQAARAESAKSAAARELKAALDGKRGEDEVKALRRKLNEAEARLKQAEAAQRDSARRAEELRLEMASAEQEKDAAWAEARKKREQAEKARAEADWLDSPFHPDNLFTWALTNGPRIVAILVGIVLLHLLARAAGRQLVHVMARNSQRGSEEERQNRAETLIGIFHSAANIVIFGGGVLMLLESAGIPIVPLLGGAAVLGLAVAFGAQNLIRDYFAGFMVLMEDQYSLNDVVKIGDVTGTVEKITLRVTVVRDSAGVVHFIPHGGISNVSNMTHGWSRALFDVGVAYKEDVDRVIAVLRELAEQLRADPAYSDLVLDGPEMQGVDALADSAVVIRFHLKTKPMKQWAVKRELLRRIKNRFDELGIEIPFPHHTVYHRHETDSQAKPKLHAA